jgi:hypothetical protein
VPNWCSNSVQISGPENLLNTLLETVHGQFCPFSFARIKPEPPEFFSRPAEEGLAMDRYSWRCENWGTKWDLDGDTPSFSSNARISCLPGKLIFLFDTAWSPCLPVIDTLSKMHPQLCVDHIYCDEAMAFAGRMSWNSGKPVLAKSYREGSPEFAAIAMGRRPEEVLQPEWDWKKDFPVLSAQEKLASHPRRPSPPMIEEEKVLSREESLMSISLSMRNATSLASAMIREAATAAAELNFPLPIWKASGLSLDPRQAWRVADPVFHLTPSSSSEFNIAVIPPSRHRLGNFSALGLVSNDYPDLLARPVMERLGMIIPVEGGMEFVAPDGWSVAVALRSPEEGYTVIKKSGLCQTPPSGRAPSTSWKISTFSNSPYLAAAAHCSSGKLWDPSRSVPSFSEWDSAGSLVRTSSFFDGKYSTGLSASSVKVYQGINSRSREKTRVSTCHK